MRKIARDRRNANCHRGATVPSNGEPSGKQFKLEVEISPVRPTGPVICRDVLREAAQHYADMQSDEEDSVHHEMYFAQPDVVAELLQKVLPFLAESDRFSFMALHKILHLVMIRAPAGWRTIEADEAAACFARASAHIDAWRSTDVDERQELVEQTVHGSPEPVLAEFLIGSLRAHLKKGLKSRRDRSFALGVLGLLECKCLAVAQAERPEDSSGRGLT